MALCKYRVNLCLKKEILVGDSRDVAVFYHVCRIKIHFS